MFHILCFDTCLPHIEQNVIAHVSPRNLDEGCYIHVRVDMIRHSWAAKFNFYEEQNVMSGLDDTPTKYDLHEQNRIKHSISDR